MVAVFLKQNMIMNIMKSFSSGFSMLKKAINLRFKFSILDNSSIYVFFRVELNCFHGAIGTFSLIDFGVSSF